MTHEHQEFSEYKDGEQFVNSKCDNTSLVNSVKTACKWLLLEPGG